MLRIEFEQYEFVRLMEICFQCSVCSLLCVVQNIDGYDSRRTFLYDLFGSENPHAHHALWACSLCHKCTEACPQEVNPARVIANLQERSFAEGYSPAYVWNLMETVLLTGRAFPVTEKTQKDRKKLGLHELKPSAVSQIQQIAELTGLRKKIEGLRSRSWVFRSLSESIRRSIARGK